MLGHWELIVLLVVVLLIFGPSQLPKLAKGIGKSIQSFKSGMKDAQDEETKSPKEVGPGEEKKELPDKGKDDD
ncbi:MAG: twin-arginine translocase TatA/TatE family subunit [Deltaproteobacteria bacterium]|nr:twin-arginine translocase TatA/TatE family subunit [Deltaproteobacteria bacterium]